MTPGLWLCSLTLHSEVTKIGFNRWGNRDTEKSTVQATTAVAGDESNLGLTLTGSDGRPWRPLVGPGTRGSCPQPGLGQTVREQGHWHERQRELHRAEPPACRGR